MLFLHTDLYISMDKFTTQDINGTAVQIVEGNDISGVMNSNAFVANMSKLGKAVKFGNQGQIDFGYHPMIRFGNISLCNMCHKGITISFWIKLLEGEGRSHKMATLNITGSLYIYLDRTPNKSLRIRLLCASIYTFSPGVIYTVSHVDGKTAYDWNMVTVSCDFNNAGYVIVNGTFQYPDSELSLSKPDNSPGYIILSQAERNSIIVDELYMWYNIQSPQEILEHYNVF